jgi:hypothetical protein
VDEQPDRLSLEQRTAQVLSPSVVPHGHSYSGVRCHGSVWPAYQSRNRPAARGTITTAPRRLRLPALVGCDAIRAPYGLRDGLGASGLQPGGSEFPLIEKSSRRK